MSDSKIINLTEAALPSQEIIIAAANLIAAIMREYPRAARDIESGVTLSLSTRSGKVFELKGKAEPGHSNPIGSIR
jgi:hypothetical protein